MPRATKPVAWGDKMIAIALHGDEWLALLNVLEATASPEERSLARVAKFFILETLARDLLNDRR